MADGPRCKRRKQANPRRNNVTNYNNVVEANSDSDDEDKLHIVEEESLQEMADAEGNVGDEDVATFSTVLGHRSNHENGWDEVPEHNLGPDDQLQEVGFKVNEECGSDGEDDCNPENMEEILQHGDTAIIYPEAPDDDLLQGALDPSGQDENGAPDTFSQLLTCPYCARGYKRYTSLREHIKLRHEKSEDNFSCSLCNYTFAHQTQLDRHMTVHKSREQRHVVPTGGNRKFKCTECGKAFKYKHHLKEHLRIHSGEKPYECSNCKKRFSHSGSYSSHISSKKCIGLISVNGRPRLGAKTSHCPSPILPASPSMPVQKLDNGKPLQEQLPLSQIKTEPMEYECKPYVMSPTQNGVFNGGGTAPLQSTTPQGLVQAVVLPTVGLVSPIIINDIQNVLKALGNAQIGVSSKELGSTGQAHPSVISAISLPIVDQDGTAKIIINYNLDPGQTQLTAQCLKKETVSNGDASKADKLPEDLTIKIDKNENSDSEKDSDTCLLCDDCPGEMDEMHKMRHCKSLKINGTDLEKSESVVSSLLSEAGLSPSQPPLKSLLSLLKAYYALNAEPTKEELSKISDSVSLPSDVVKKWFEKMHTGRIAVETPTTQSERNAHPVESEEAQTDSTATCPDQADQIITGGDAATHYEPAEASPASPSPLNLTAGGPVAAKPPGNTEEPLDLSLPKLPAVGSLHPNSVYSIQEEPLNLTCFKKDMLQCDLNDASPAPLYVTTTSANPLNVVTTQLPTIVAIADKSKVPCLRALTTNNKTILIPQLTYSYSASGNSPVGTETQQKAVQANGSQEDTSSEGISTMEEQNDSDSTPPRKRMRKADNGMYACDLCDKIFQKSSSLLRHKYEHTGKRPHECTICNKAFKHKHHLIEHMRLHSGEKPYQCDKCGKRFSHSGSYSQHMNHRYSYCKKETQEQSDAEAEMREGLMLQPAFTLPSHLDSDDRESSTREDEESEDDSSVNEDEIRVVRIGDDGERDASEDEELVEENAEEGMGVKVLKEGETEGWAPLELDAGGEGQMERQEVETSENAAKKEAGLGDPDGSTDGNIQDDTCLAEQASEAGESQTRSP